MKYYLISVNENYTAPVPIGWYGILDRKSIRQKRACQMPKYLGFMVDSHLQMVFTDVISFPCFMTSKKVKKVIEQYDTSVKFVRVIFFDKDNKRSMAYYIPFVNTIVDSYSRNLKGEIIVEREKVQDCIIFQIYEADRTYTAMRMDVVESILRRNALGIGIKEIQII